MNHVGDRAASTPVFGISDLHLRIGIGGHVFQLAEVDGGEVVRHRSWQDDPAVSPPGRSGQNGQGGQCATQRGHDPKR